MAPFCEIRAVTGSPEEGKERSEGIDGGNMRECGECGRMNMRKGKRTCMLSWVQTERNKDDEGGRGTMKEKTGGKEGERQVYKCRRTFEGTKSSVSLKSSNCRHL